MDFGAILLLVAALVLIGLFLAQPFLERQHVRRTSAVAGHERSTLLAERDSVLTALQELDFDNALGKIPAEDYPKQRAALLQHGAEVLRKLDTLTPQPAQVADAESRIEAVIAARRVDSAQPVAIAEAPAADDDIESLISARRSGRKEKSAGFCPNCGKPVLRSDRFCPNCGKAIKA